jgi:hypothetical protein
MPAGSPPISIYVPSPAPMFRSPSISLPEPRVRPTRESQSRVESSKGCAPPSSSCPRATRSSGSVSPGWPRGPTARGVATLTSKPVRSPRQASRQRHQSRLNSSPLAWLRDIPELPSTTNINCIVERLAFVHAISVPTNIGGAVHEHRFRQFMREGATAAAFLLSDYSARRRRATLVASLADLETRLSDAAAEMFEKLVGSLFTRAKRGQERSYQVTARDVGQLMRLFGCTIAALLEAREGQAAAMPRAFAICVTLRPSLTSLTASSALR